MSKPFSKGLERQTGAIVIGGNYSGLGVARSLGRRGIPVWVLARQLGGATASRYTGLTLPWPSDPKELLEYLLSLGANHGLDGWVLYPTEDRALTVISSNHELLSKRYRLITAPWEVIRKVHDKWLLHQLAGELGIDRPWTMLPTDREQLSALDLPFPVILKPALKTAENAFTYDRAWLAPDRETLLARYDEARALAPADTIMVQELIPGVGHDYAYGALSRDGHPVASAVVWRPRQYPIGFGRASTYVETIDLPVIEEAGRKVLAALGLTGLVHIGFKLDPRDGRYKLLDVNPRVWSSHALGRQAGVDFAYLQWRLVHDQPLPSDLRTPPGLRWIRLVTDFYVAAQLLRRGQLSLPEYLRSFLGPVQFSAFAWDDPVPAMAGLPLIRRRPVHPVAGERQAQIAVSTQAGMGSNPDRAPSDTK